MGAAAAVVSAVVIDAMVITAETMTVLEAITAVGATLGAIGAVTGNKDLAMAGMAMGVVGGIGSLASNAGLLGEEGAGGLFGAQTTESVNPNFGAADAVPGEVAVPADATLPGAADVVAPADAGQNNFVDALGEAHADQISPVGDISQQTGAATGDPQSLINGPANGVPTVAPPEGGYFAGQDASQMTTGADYNANNPAQVTGDTSAGAVTGKPVATGAVTGAPSAGGNVTGTPVDPSLNFTGQSGGTVTGDQPFAGAKDFVSGQAANGGGPGVFSKIIDFAKNNQMVTYGIMQAGGSLLSGLTNPVTPAQVNALNAQADANRAAANLNNRQAANAGQRLPTATRPTTNSPNPAPPAGLINGG